MAEQVQIETLIVTGATGFIGRHLINKLLEVQAPLKIRALTRQSTVDFGQKVEVVSGDISDQVALETLLVADSVVVNLAFSNTDTSGGAIRNIEALAEACIKAGVKRFIHCSSISVYGRVTGLITEATACKPVDDYGRTKLKVEERLRALASGNFELVILRVAEVFGEGGKSLLSLINSLSAGRSYINYVRSCMYGERRTHYVPVEFVVSVIEYFCFTRKRFSAEIFIVSADDEPLNNFQSIEKICREELHLAMYKFPVVRLPRICLEWFFRLFNKPTIDSRIVYSPRKLNNLEQQCNDRFEELLRKFISLNRGRIIK